MTIITVTKKIKKIYIFAPNAANYVFLAGKKFAKHTKDCWNEGGKVKTHIKISPI